ncbi:EF-P 5-aminopentanol modification-associated protein YfmH [Virgibacillus necropolis]|uniref:Peptidase M16 n=1 Tax=Virgibacillus necropolis TaxID=163877 RepID=A0A221MDG6_9BACI|nr:pitrilysin family protein [Virgibacillus necropolis]ASN05674.1 peptidase M16 [Virgibacillus necropolis]
MSTKRYDDINEVLRAEKLANGLNVFLLPKRELSKTFAIFSTDYGSIDLSFVPRNKQDAVTVPEGVAHFLEHKLFEKEDHDVFADFSKQGASANAFTSFTQTAYLFTATNYIEQNVETLLDFVQEPYFSDQSVEKEKGIIGQEITMYDDQPDWRVFMGTIQNLFHHHPVKVDIAGTVESIASITKEDLYECYQTFYHPDNMTLFIAGNFDEENMMELIKQNQLSKEFPPSDQIKRIMPDEPKEVYKKETTINMPVSIPKCSVGIKGLVNGSDSDTFLVTDLVQGMIVDFYFSEGGSFYQELYQEGIIDNSFYFETTVEKGFGYAIIGSNTSKPEEFEKRVKEMLLSIKEKKISEAEFERMKKKQIGQLLRAMNSIEFIAKKYIHYHTMGIDFLEIIPRLQSLTYEEVSSFLKDWIKEEQLTTFKIKAE